jgi:hypothetical protein
MDVVAYRHQGAESVCELCPYAALYDVYHGRPCNRVGYVECKCRKLIFSVVELHNFEGSSVHESDACFKPSVSKLGLLTACNRLLSALLYKANSWTSAHATFELRHDRALKTVYSSLASSRELTIVCIYWEGYPINGCDGVVKCLKITCTKEGDRIRLRVKTLLKNLLETKSCWAPS